MLAGLGTSITRKPLSIKKIKIIIKKKIIIANQKIMFNVFNFGTRNLSELYEIILVEQFHFCQLGNLGNYSNLKFV